MLQHLFMTHLQQTTEGEQHRWRDEEKRRWIDRKRESAEGGKIVNLNSGKRDIEEEEEEEGGEWRRMEENINKDQVWHSLLFSSHFMPAPALASFLTAGDAAAAVKSPRLNPCFNININHSPIIHSPTNSLPQPPLGVYLTSTKPLPRSSLPRVYLKST